ncbi:MAG: fumarylacetoacetate hydrolase family protein [Bdellovibrionaceae bacterium]|nr:fumarylacetoacetate hydrolase family protein [Pseudobdellovibrionaceae bacterium]MDW8189643.1 fumarylacetoacetate hydrolase family protein [Pseudobdellovibrionaceae bacterium]
MIFASARNGHPDGELLLVHPNRLQAVSLQKLLPNLEAVRHLRTLLENWSLALPYVQEIDDQLRRSQISQVHILDLRQCCLMACMPRTWLFADGSAFLHHIKLVRKARGAEMPPNFLSVPLIYQGESGHFLGPQDPIPQRDESDGTDFEGEIGVFTDYVPLGCNAEKAGNLIRLVTLINDISLRHLIPSELAMGFGFFVSKPQSALAPFAVTLDELHPFWRDHRLHLPLRVTLNGERFGQADAGRMHFSFAQIIAHAAQTRPLVAGTLIGSGTVSNEEPDKGFSCIVEKRTQEQLLHGQPLTPYLRQGDRVRIEVLAPEGNVSLFGAIDQVVQKLTNF